MILLIILNTAYYTIKCWEWSGNRKTKTADIIRLRAHTHTHKNHFSGKYLSLLWTTMKAFSTTYDNYMVCTKLHITKFPAHRKQKQTKNVTDDTTIHSKLLPLYCSVLNKATATHHKSITGFKLKKRCHFLIQTHKYIHFNINWLSIVERDVFKSTL